MTNSITPKVAYIPLEYHMSVEDFLEVWKDMEVEHMVLDARAILDIADELEAHYG